MTKLKSGRRPFVIRPSSLFRHSGFIIRISSYGLHQLRHKLPHLGHQLLARESLCRCLLHAVDNSRADDCAISDITDAADGLWLGDAKPYADGRVDVPAKFGD